MSGFSLNEAYHHGVCHSSEDIEKKRGQHTSLPQPLMSDVKPLRVFTIIRTHASSRGFMELADNG